MTLKFSEEKKMRCNGHHIPENIDISLLLNSTNGIWNWNFRQTRRLDLQSFAHYGKNLKGRQLDNDILTPSVACYTGPMDSYLDEKGLSPMKRLISSLKIHITLYFICSLSRSHSIWLFAVSNGYMFLCSQVDVADIVITFNWNGQKMGCGGYTHSY